MKFLKQKFLVFIFMVMLLPAFYAAVTNSATNYNGYVDIPLTAVSQVSGNLIEQLAPTANWGMDNTYPYLAPGSNTDPAIKMLFHPTHPFTAGFEYMAQVISPAKVTVYVPDDFNPRGSGGALRILLGQDYDAVSPDKIQFKWELAVTPQGSATDTFYTVNTPVYADFSSNQYQSAINLVVSGENIKPGDRLEFRFWRVWDNTVAVAEIYKIAYVYPRKY